MGEEGEREVGRARVCALRVDATCECECLGLPDRMPRAHAWAVAPLGETREMHELHDCILIA